MKRFLKLRYLLWTLVSLVTLYFLLIALENWTGARALAAARARIEAAGETLDFKRLLPAPIPDSVNFCALEALAGITDPKHQPAEALTALDWGKHHPKAKTPLPISSIPHGKPADLKPWLAYLAEIAVAKADATPFDAMRALDEAFPLLKTFSDAAPTRTSALFTPPFGEGQQGGPLAIQLPHYALIRPLAKALAFRAQLAVAAGDAAGSIHSIQACLRLVEAAFAEPVMIGLLVGESMHLPAQEAVWSLLHARLATDAQLAELQRDLARLDHHAAALQAMRGELAAITETLLSSPDVFGLVMNAEGAPSQGLAGRMRRLLLPAGFIDHSAANIINVEYEHLVAPLKTGSTSAALDAVERVGPILMEKRGWTNPHWILASIAVPATPNILRSVCFNDSINRQALIALAIERHRLATGQLPATLEALVPVYLKAVPQDLMNDQPMRYRVDNNAYSLWSVGSDHEDNHGQLPNKEQAHGQWRADYKGDWVWHLPAQLK